MFVVLSIQHAVRMRRTTNNLINMRNMEHIKMFITMFTIARHMSIAGDMYSVYDLPFFPFKSTLILHSYVPIGLLSRLPLPGF